MPVAAALFVPESSHQWSCVMSRLRFSELFAAERSTASLYRLTGHHEKAEALAPLVPPQASPPTAAPALDLPELLALLTIAATPLAREMVQVLRSEGVTLHGPCFRALRALNWACITPRGYHELTPIGAAKADALAIEAARERGLHLPMFYRLRGHMRERASNGVRCTCGWSANTGSGGAGLAWNEHLQAVTQPEDNWRSLGEIVGPSIVPED